MNFFISSFIDFSASLGFQINCSSLNIILPVGVSFYTFQVSSYVIDVYGKKSEASNNLLDFSVFIAFFPQLVAGPIERAGSLLPQFERPRNFNSKDFSSGSFLILSGYFKKLVIADNVALFSDHVFNLQNNVQGVEVFIGFLAFSLQIYCDFSGYTDIARGSARILGFNLMENFKFPYLSKSPREFWSRWHISLSTWLRDYLYIPLGGNRVSEIAIYRNLMITMLLGGLWHGANWTFVIWGAFHGGLLIIYRFFGLETFLSKLSKKSPISLISWAVWILFVVFGWGIFRAESFTDYIELLHRLDLNPFAEWKISLFYVSAYLFILGFFETTLFLSSPIFKIMKKIYILRAIYCMGIFYLIIIYGAFRGSEFIYFQF